MNLTAARGMLPIANRLDRSPKLAYLPKPLRSRWWRPRATLTDLLTIRLARRERPDE